MSTVFTEDRGAVRHVALNRPEKRNAMNQELLRELGETLRTAAADNDVHCVVLPGEGPVFSAGVDLGEFPALAGELGRSLREVFLGRAKDLIMTARKIDGAEAERIAPVNRVAAPDKLEQATQQLVDELLANSHLAVGRAKRVSDASARPALALSLELEPAVQEYCLVAAQTSDEGETWPITGLR